uniref:Leucine rich immune protein (Coil-less) n=1 Tax=Anopheles farauti TaxID=69004 RepID=A0A182QEG5_9DIPT
MEGTFVLKHIPPTYGVITLHNLMIRSFTSKLFDDFKATRSNASFLCLSLAVESSAIRSFALESGDTFDYMQFHKTQLKTITFGWNCSVSLDLSNNAIHTLFYSSDGARSSSLVDVFLNNNKLRSINLNLFRPMKLLRQLDLSHNHITFVTGALVAESLSFLDLSFNRLFEMDCCQWFVPNFTDLIARNNTFQLLPKCMERVLANVSYIAFDNNHLHVNEMYKFGTLSNLKRLSLMNNKLTHITLNEQTLPVQLFLENIDLSSNNITSLNASSVSSADVFPVLKEIYLNGNILTTLDENNFNGMKSLIVADISNNRIFAVRGVLLNINELLDSEIWSRLSALRFQTILDVSYNAQPNANLFNMSTNLAE